MPWNISSNFEPPRAPVHSGWFAPSSSSAISSPISAFLLLMNMGNLSLMTVRSRQDNSIWLNIDRPLDSTVIPICDLEMINVIRHHGGDDLYYSIGWALITSDLLLTDSSNPLLFQSIPSRCWVECPKSSIQLKYVARITMPQVNEKSAREGIMPRSRARSADRLPPEIIAQIIAFASHEQLPDCSLDGFHCSRRTLALSHVSRQWRDIALGSSPLWASIHSDYSFDLMTACLARSHSASLRVCIDMPIAVKREWFLDLLRPVTHRIASLSIQQRSRVKGPGIPLKDILRAASTEATRLETLYVDVSRQGATDTDIQILFSGSTPALRHLSLRGILHTPGHLFKNLTHLHLYPRGQLQCRDLYDIIRNSPDLEILDLEGAITSILPPQPLITLNHLQKLSITHSPWNMVQPFLACLDIPPTCDFTFLTANGSPQSNDHVLTSALPADLTHFRPLHGATKLLLGAPNTMALCGSNGRSTFELFSTWVADPPRFFEASLLALPHAFPLSAVRELWLGPHAPGGGASAHTEPARDTWAAFFAALPRLHTLVLLPGFLLPDVLDALAPPAAPALHTLRLVCGRFHALLPWCVLRDFVRARRDAGLGLRRVWVQDLAAQMGRPPGRGSWGGVLRYECEVAEPCACPVKANDEYVAWSRGLEDVLAM